MNDLKNLQDTALLGLVGQGNAQALEVLFERYYQELCAFAFRFLKSPDLSQEVVSDIFLKLWLNRQKENPPQNLKAYLFSATKNQALNYLKKEENFSEVLGEMPENDFISDDIADKNISLQELEAQMDALLNEMPPQRQLIFRMNRLEGLKYKEIAQKLSISVHTVQNQMVEAVKFISQKYPHLDTLKIFLLLYLTQL
jgi:RNA polymerase sigma-70 factor, ECF subfamily